MSSSGIANTLEQQGIIRYASLFRVMAHFSGISNSLKSGRYVFEEREPLWTVLMRVSRGKYGTHTTKVTIPEGSSNEQISKIVGLGMGQNYQGYLFPDTYFIDEFATGDEIREMMRANFTQKVGDILYEDLILASLVEEEASSTIDRRVIAGILEKRLSLGMPLQVNVALETYDFKGLPSQPITNPGLDAINAVRNPEESKYLYYLSDKSSVIHYARNFEEHKANRDRYGI
ncbi:MAG TPA: endolytic transglycosylase MltG [Candidatus Paceibacterota bacterium]